MDIHRQAYAALMLCNIEQKLRAVESLFHNSLTKSATTCEMFVAERIETPGRPNYPLLVLPHEVPKRKTGSKSGRLAQFHAFAHIEFNAINLALDAVYRFPGLPSEYYCDWLKVAHEEAQHFVLLRDYLRARDIEYGDFNAHNNLWDMAVSTDHDVMVRMALVPRVLEARGLDVTPRIINKLKAHGNKEGAQILQTIYEDEIGHVKIGNYWFNHLCKQRGLNPIATFSQLLRQYTRGYLSGPFNSEARLLADFSPDELEVIYSLEKQFLSEQV